MTATITDAKTAHKGGFIRPMIVRTTLETFDAIRWEGISAERILNAGNDVNDSREIECKDRLSNLSVTGSEVDVDLVDWLVE